MIENSPSRTSRGLSPLLACVAVAMVGVIFLALYTTADVVEEGQILSYTPANAERISTVVGVELIVQNEPPNRVDSLTAAMLIAIAMIGALLFLALPGARPKVQWFYSLLGLGAALLAVDEILGAHEAIGANMQFLGDLPGVNSPEDVVFGLYLLPALAFLIFFREKLASTTVSRWAITTGLLLFIAAAMLDVLDAIMDEQLVEAASIAALLVGFTSIALHDLGKREPHDPVSSSESGAPMLDVG